MIASFDKPLAENDPQVMEFVQMVDCERIFD